MGVRSALKRFLTRLEKANEKEFGGRAPDCCFGKVTAGPGKVSTPSSANKAARK